MRRETRIQCALADIPVPTALLADAGYLVGIRCYVMEKVPGRIIGVR